MLNKKRLALALASATLVLLSGCSLDIVPVHTSRVNAAKMAEQPLLRGPAAPGAFKRAWNFNVPKGYLFDPSQLEFSGGLARLKTDAKGRKEAILVTQDGGAPYVALDSFNEDPGPHSQGHIRYQLSPNGSTWYHYNGKSWVAAASVFDQANTPDEINAHIGHFHLDVGAGSLTLRVFLVSPTGKEPVELKAVTLQGISPRVDGWD